MKFRIAALVLLNTLCVFSAAGTRAQSLDESPDKFPYVFLQPQRINLCAGVVPKVLSVGRVGATFSGGAHGTVTDWTQEIIDNAKVIIEDDWGGDVPRAGRMHRTYRRSIPYHDLRGEIEANLADANIFKPFTYDQHFSQAVAPAVLMMERLAVRESTVKICISRFDLVKVHQTRGLGTDIEFDIAFKVHLEFGDSERRSTMLVQELRGKQQVRSAFYDIYYDNHIRAQALISNSWPNLMAGFSQTLTAEANREADANLGAVRAELAAITGEPIP